MARPDSSTIRSLLVLMGRQLGLCRHHVERAPWTLPRRKNEGRLA